IMPILVRNSSAAEKIVSGNLVDHPFLILPSLPRMDYPQVAGSDHPAFCFHWEVLMTDREKWDQDQGAMSRRTLVKGLAAGVGAVMAGAGSPEAQTGPAAPPTTITNPPRDFSPRGAPTTYFWDPDILAVDPQFNALAQPNTAIKRLYTGMLWPEGPAWS